MKSIIKTISFFSIIPIWIVFGAFLAKIFSSGILGFVVSTVVVILIESLVFKKINNNPDIPADYYS